MPTSEINPNFYINVAEKMKEQNNLELPRPRLKRTVIVNKNEWLPIIKVECEL